MNRTDPNLPRQNGIETTEKAIGRYIVDDVNMNGLTPRVNTGIGATGADKRRGGAPGHRSEGLFELTLNGSPFRLALPTLESASKISDNNFRTISHSVILAWESTNEKVPISPGISTGWPTLR